MVYGCMHTSWSGFPYQFFCVKKKCEAIIACTMVESALMYLMVLDEEVKLIRKSIYTKTFIGNCYELSNMRMQ